MESLYVLIIYFALGAFLGKIIERGFLFGRKKKIVKTGFLYGPFSPIYGFVILIIYFFELFSDSIIFPMRLVIYFLIPSAIEYFTSYSLEKIFNLRLWDYSKYKFNINGRVCLEISLAWFALTLFVVLAGQPFVINLLNKIPFNIIRAISITFVIYFATDLIMSIRENYLLKREKIRIIHKD